MTEVGTEAAPAVETTEAAPSKVDDVARAVLDRKSKRDAKKGAPTAETREFWETWAEEKSTREPAPAAAEATEASEPADEEAAEARPSRSSRGDKDKGRGRDKDRGARDKDRGRDKRSKSETKLDRPERGDKSEKSEKSESRTKRDTVVTPPPTDASGGAQARLFVSLGKKHGVSADDLRELLAAAIGGDKARIGSVSLRDSHAHVRVSEDLAEKIIATVNGTTHNEHDVTVERARA